MSQHIKLKKGYDIKIAGEAEKRIVACEQPKTFAVKPDDFKGILRPKLSVQEGDKVKAGSPLFYDKKNTQIKYTAPVSGEVVEIVRGEKRKIEAVVILADEKVEYHSFKKYSISELMTLSKEDATVQITESGLWPSIIQRPFGVVAHPEETPKSIFISAFDSHPLAPDYNFIYKDDQQNFQAGIDVLKKFTSGNIHLNINATAEVGQLFAHAKNVTLNKFTGKHPAGNVG
ncbi:MAG: NADH:ubiquinone reductase (Na(+)-transporting) subunit A, partial [Cyclobacteriaceae bacterium]|nr:NADH:ubiquinone reductase (Na(+)-transporting) subunit A [Cyclobacteriaceae bacterium]